MQPPADTERKQEHLLTRSLCLLNWIWPLATLLLSPWWEEPGAGPGLRSIPGLFSTCTYIGLSLSLTFSVHTSPPTLEDKPSQRVLYHHCTPMHFAKDYCIHFPHLQNGHDDNTYYLGWLWKLNKCLAQCVAFWNLLQLIQPNLITDKEIEYESKLKK